MNTTYHIGHRELDEDAKLAELLAQHRPEFLGAPK